MQDSLLTWMVSSRMGEEEDDNNEHHGTSSDVGEAVVSSSTC